MICQRTSRLVVAIVILLLVSASATAGSPQVISHQGHLTSAEGIPLTGTHALSFSLYDVALGGAALWSENHAAVEVDEGLYALLLGSITPFTAAAFSGPERFLGISVDGGAELSPRRQIAATAFAFYTDKAADADSLNGQAPSFYLNWANLTGVPAGFADGVDNTGSGDITAVTAGEGLGGGGTSGTVNIYLDTGGVATKNISNGTIINEDISASAAIATSKISGTAMNLSSLQVATGEKYFNGGLHVGDSTFDGNNAGIVIGTNTYSPSSSYLLLAARNYSTTSARQGLYADIDNFSTGTVYGIRSRASGATAGAANAGTVYGFYGVGISDGDYRYGGYFNARARTVDLGTGSSHGLYSEASYGSGAYGAELHATNATSGYGVYVEVSDNLTGTGSHTYVHDNTGSSSSIGSNNFVLSNGGTAYGVSGTVGSNGGTGYAVYGHAYGNATNWSGYFTGDVYVGGTVFMPAKITKIDHPLDPENQFLMLAGIDSPEMLVKTSGIVTTDNSGQAIVMLPAYFVAIADNFRYQLTVIGEFAQAIVGSEVVGNQFSIKTDKPNIKVSWEITGERIDKFAVANRIVNQMTKSAEQRGRYLHPEAFGLTSEVGIDYPTLQALMKKPERSQPSPTSVEPGE